jgi:superfamily II DNA or RNA helicase
MFPITLYDFQEEAIRAVLNAWQNLKKRSVMISAPTGAGKTIIFSSLIRAVVENTSNRALILVHRDSLLQQAIEKLHTIWPLGQVGVVKAKTLEYNQQITVASIETLKGRVKEFIEACLTHGPITHVIMDEAHHSYAPVWRVVFEALKENPVTVFLGVTATPIRTNKKELLTDIFEEVVYSISLFQLIEDGKLVPITGYTVPTSLSLDKSNVRTTQGDYNVRDLAIAAANSDFNRIVVSAWKEKASERRSICFAIHIAHIETLVEALNAVGAKAVGIHGKLPLEQQRQILRDFKDGKYNVLVNCMLLTEGFDEPCIDCVLMARPTQSKTLYIQMVGRGLRLFQPDKKDCLLLDFTSNTENNAMITMMDLLSFYGMSKAAELYKNEQQERRHKDPSVKEILGDHAIPFILGPDTLAVMEATEAGGIEMKTSIAYSEIDVFKTSDYAWTDLAGESFVIVRQDVSIALMQVENNMYEPYIIFKTRNDSCKALIAPARPKKGAIAIANVFLYDYGNKKITGSGETWRLDPPTAEQTDALNKAINSYNTKYGSAISLDGIAQTRGAYSDMLTAIYSSGYLRNPWIQVVDRDAAIAKLGRIIISELTNKKQKRDQMKIQDYHKEEPAQETNDIRLALYGNYRASDRTAIIEVITNLCKIPNGKYPAQFLKESQIVFEGDNVKVVPPKPLSPRQSQWVHDKIPPIFRLSIRDKMLTIVEPEEKPILVG